SAGAALRGDLGRHGTTVVAPGRRRNPHREGWPPGRVAQAGGGALRPVLRGRADHLSGVSESQLVQGHVAVAVHAHVHVNENVRGAARAQRGIRGATRGWPVAGFATTSTSVP